MSNNERSAPVGRGRPSISDSKRHRMRSDIADCAKRLFQEEGYATISMRRIAREIGCSPMTLYKYYDAKIDILRTLWTGVFDDLFDQLQADPQPPKSDLHALATGYVQYWLDHTEYYRLVFLAEGVSQPDVSIFIDNPDLVQRFSIFAEAIADACAVKPDADTLKVKLDGLLCFLNGIAHNMITISGYAWSKPDRMVDMAVEAVIS